MKNIRKQRILVTGGAGFLGRELVKQLVDLGYIVRVVDLSPRPSNLPECEYIKGNLVKNAVAGKAFKDVDYCVHLAAMTGGIRYYHKYPGSIIDGNNNLYSSVFKAAVKYKVSRIIYTSSSMVYGSTNNKPLSEDSLGKFPPPASSYGFSKLMGEYYCRFFWEEFGLKFTICRLFNLYGLIPRDLEFSHVIPDIAKKVISGQYPVEILGDGNQTRCFTHVEDVARGIILALNSADAENKIFNFGSNKEIKIIDLAETIFKICFPNRKFKYILKRGFKMDVKKQIPVINEARKILGWRPTKKLMEEIPIIINDMKLNMTK